MENERWKIEIAFVADRNEPRPLDCVEERDCPPDAATPLAPPVSGWRTGKGNHVK
jgi:hypothetical protein